MENINPKEILEIAIQNEKNGVEFYSKLVEQINNENSKKILSELILQERKHIDTIKQLINKLMQENEELDYYDDPEELLYLQAIAGTSTFSDKYDTTRIKEILSDPIAALHYAVGIEIKNIEFYKELYALIPSEGGGKDVVKELIEEEKGHVKNLYKMIKEYEG